MSPFLTAFLGGVAGGASFALVLALIVVLFGRTLAERFLKGQVANLETLFREKVVDVVLAKITGFLDQSERIAQIARRVMEIVQLLMNRAPLPEPAGGAAAGASALAQGHATLGSALAALGRKEDARHAFEEALRLDPRLPGALQGLKELG